jgi:hypothetical protein
MSQPLRISMAATALVLALMAVASAAAAKPRNLRIADAERAAAAALAPSTVEQVRCFRPASRPSGVDRRRAMCIVVHPAAPGSLCRSLVMVRAPRAAGAGARTRIIRRDVCIPVHGIQP